MIMLTKEQLADLLREAFDNGANGLPVHLKPGSGAYHLARERAIQPLVHRSSGGHDDHGREVAADEAACAFQIAGTLIADCGAGEIRFEPFGDLRIDGERTVYFMKSGGEKE